MSDTEVTDAEASDDGPAALPGDGLREGIVAALRDDLGTGLVDTHLVPQTDLWVRVTPEAWALAGAALKAQGFEFFCFLSAIDWMPSPYGKSEDDTIPTLADVTAAIDAAQGARESDDAPAVEVAAGEDAAGESSAGDEAGDDGDAASGASAADDEDADEHDEERPTLRTGYAGGESRFQLVARLVDIERHVGVTVKADVPDTLTMPTWIPHFAGANWHEREVHEMFGIGFDGHPDLRNLYLPSDFEGYPLRKDFPLLSRLVKPWPGIADIEPMPDFDSTDGEAS